MNNENANKLINALRKEEIAKFNMRWYLKDKWGDYWDNIDEFLESQGEDTCGTTACMGGMAALLSGKKEGSADEAAQEWLGITNAEAYWLFSGSFNSKDMSDITVEQAIEALEWIMADKPIRDDCGRLIRLDQLKEAQSE